MNDENLIPTNMRSKSEARALASKGGKKSGEVRRRKADMRRAAQDILSKVYTDASGKSLTGAEALVTNLFKISMDEKHKQAMSATRMLIELSGNNKGENELLREKEEIALMKAKRKMIEGGDDLGLKKLDKILEGMNFDANN